LFAIDERLDIVEAFVNDSSIRTFITQDFLSRVPDFERLVRKFIRKKANLEVKDSEYSSQSRLLSIRIVIKSMLLLIKCRN
jgi:DNA mismatch repair protein MSH2